LKACLVDQLWLWKSLFQLLADPTHHRQQPFIFFFLSPVNREGIGHGGWGHYAGGGVCSADRWRHARPHPRLQALGPMWPARGSPSRSGMEAVFALARVVATPHAMQLREEGSSASSHDTAEVEATT
jgi:hypothetical protein